MAMEMGPYSYSKHARLFLVGQLRSFVLGNWERDARGLLLTLRRDWNTVVVGKDTLAGDNYHR